MGKIILTSNGVDSSEIANELFKCINSTSKIAIITTANEEKEKSQNCIKSQQALSSFCPRHIAFFDIEKQEMSNLLNYDIIYFDDGNPFKILSVAQNSNLKMVIELLMEQNKLIIGKNAGSLIFGHHIGLVHALSPELNKNVKIRNLGGINIFNYCICPRYDKLIKKYPNLDESIKSLELKYKSKFVKLNDGEAIIIDSNNKNVYKKISGKEMEMNY